MRVGFFLDSLPVNDDGFSQRVIREIGLVSGIDNAEIFLYAISSLRPGQGMNAEKKLHKVYDPLGVREYRVRFHVSSRFVISRKLYDDYYIEQAVRFIQQYKIECLICENLWAAYIGGKACAETDTRFIFDYHGAVPEEFVYSGYCKAGGKKFHYYKGIEKWALQHASAVICVSNVFKSYLIRTFGLSGTKVTVVPCCINAEDIAYDLEARNAIRRQLSLEDRKVIIYAGSIAGYHCIDEMVWLFREILKRDPSFYFIFLSANVSGPSARKVFVKYGIPEDSYCIKSVPHAEVKKYYSASDYGMIIREDHLMNRVASPTKIPEYLESGLTVIGTACIGDIGEIETDNIILDYKDVRDRNPAVADKIAKHRISAEQRTENYHKCAEILRNTYTWEQYKDLYRRKIFDE